MLVKIFSCDLDILKDKADGQAADQEDPDADSGSAGGRVGHEYHQINHLNLRAPDFAWSLSNFSAIVATNLSRELCKWYLKGHKHYIRVGYMKFWVMC